MDSVLSTAILTYPRGLGQPTQVIDSLQQVVAIGPIYGADPIVKFPGEITGDLYSETMQNITIFSTTSEVANYQLLIKFQTTGAASSVKPHHHAHTGEGS